MSATATTTEHVGSGEVEQENAPANPAPAAPAAPKARKSTAVNLIGTRYEEFVTDGRFKPGYDAKAKSQMVNDAISDDPELVAEAERVLDIMNWTQFLTTKREALAAKANKPEPGPRKLTGAAKKAADAKAAREASGSGPATEQSNNEELAATMPTENTIWIRQGRRGVFVMRGETPLRKFETTEATNATEFAQTSFDEAGGEGAGLTLNLTPQD